MLNIRCNPYLHFMSISSFWLNLAERIYGLQAEKQLSCGVYASVKELGEFIMKYITKTGEHLSIQMVSRRNPGKQAYPAQFNNFDCQVK